MADEQCADVGNVGKLKDRRLRSLVRRDTIVLTYGDGAFTAISGVGFHFTISTNPQRPSSSL